MSKNTDYTYTGSGTNSQGNHWCSREDTATGNESYHYSNTDGSYYYSNSNGSTYYSDPSGGGHYTAPSEESATKE